MKHPARMTSVLMLLSIGAALLGAQQPKPPAHIAGRVTTAGGTPVPGAEVRLDNQGEPARTDERGAFVFVKATPGVHVLVARRIGYIPASAPVRVPETSDSVVVLMVPSRSTLDTVQVKASLNVLAGVIIDSTMSGVSDAQVQLIGTRTGSTQTDLDGAFAFTSVRSGNVVLRVRKLGYEPAFYSVNLDDWRGVVLRLTRVKSGLSASKTEMRSGFGNRADWVWRETHDRLVQRGVAATVVPREELDLFGDLSLGQAVRFSRSGGLAAVDLQPPLNDVCVLIDGERVVGQLSLDTFRANEVSFVELYPPGSESSGTVARYLRNAGCRSPRTSARGGRGPYYAVVWLRA